ncbi:MAG: site-specific integrase [Candidatus Micrarchaeota archaeon]
MHKFAFQNVRALPKANIKPGTANRSRLSYSKSNLQYDKPSRKETKQLWPEAKETLEFLGRFLPKQRLIKAIEVLSVARKRRFLRRRIPKYGTINKGFTEPELIHFLNAIDDPKILLLFTYQAVLGLRIGEVVKLHIRDINLETRELKIDNQKGDRFDVLPIPPQLFDQTLNYITENEQDISHCKGYLFWAERFPNKNDCPHISKNYARVIFRKIIKKLKLDETYGLSDGQNPKLLHRLSTHSLRHYAVTNFSKKNNGNVVLTSKFARHSRIETTMIYIHTGKDELQRSVSLAQENGIFSRVKKIQERI